MSDIDELCACKRTQIRERIVRGGAIQHIRQCLDCGYPVGSPVRQAGAVPLFDEALQKAVEIRKAEMRAHRKEAESTEWHVNYAAYLESYAWADLRARVMDRDSHLCQGCLKAKAEVVHHQTYKHVGCEFAFELISLCHACHTRFHAEDAA